MHQEQVRILRVVIASPGDVKAEREIISRVIEEVNRNIARPRGLHLDVYRWETDSYPGFHPQGPQGPIDPTLKIEDCDILIGIFWRRFGTPVSDAKSGTEHEFRLAYNAWKRNQKPQIMVYFSQKSYTPKSKEEADQWRLVLQFKKEFPGEGLWWEYKNKTEFEQLLRNHLTQLLTSQLPKRPTIFLASSLSRRALAITRELAEQLQASANVTVWSEGPFDLSATLPGSFTEMADKAELAAFVLTDDDDLTYPITASRANVMFELGLLVGRIGLARMFLIVAERGKIRLPSELGGITLPEGLGLSETVAPAAAALRRALVKTGSRVEHATEFFSCFMSYSWKDREFAARLYDDLQQVGVRCWLDVKEIRSGEKIAEQIGRAIQAHDKVLLVLSEASVHSSWVREEIRRASELERGRNQTVLFPVRLDGSVLSIDDQQEISHLRERFIIDFSGWKDRVQYQRAFSQLVRDLTISASIESKGHN